MSDGRHFLFVVLSGDLQSDGVYLGTAGSPVKKRILPDLTLVAVTRDGYLLFRRQALMAQRLDVARGELTGDAITVADAVRGDILVTGVAAFSVSESGALAYRSGAAEPTRYVWFDRTGKELEAVPGSENMSEPALSPDGKRMTSERRDTDNLAADVWSLDLARETSTRLTFGNSDSAGAIWSPDGSRIVFASSRAGNYDLYEKPSNGATPERLLLKTELVKWPDDWSRDGKFLLFEATDAKMQGDLWLLPLSGDQKPVVYLQTPFNEVHGQFSPDGKWIAYASDETGETQVYVQSVPISDGKWQISKSGGDQPAWRNDGKELFYLSADRKMMAVPTTIGSAFQMGAPQALFDAPVQAAAITGDRNYYVASADGQRFLLRKVFEEKPPTPITIALDWNAGLAKK